MSMFFTVEPMKAKVIFTRQISEPVTSTEKKSVSFDFNQAGKQPTVGLQQNPKLEDNLVRGKTQGAEPSIDLTSDLLNQSNGSAGRRPSENTDTAPYGQPLAPPTGHLQNTMGHFNPSSSPGNGQVITCTSYI